MPQPKWAVVRAVPRTDYSLELSFADGTKGVFDTAQLFEDRYYEPLSALPLFMTARAECGTVVWDDDRDIAPELLYEKCTAR